MLNSKRIVHENKEIKRIVQENKEIKAFLKDYGMQWVGVGQPPSGASSVSSSSAQSPDSAAGHSPETALGARDLKLNEGLWQPGVALGQRAMQLHDGMRLNDAMQLNDASGPEALGVGFDPVRMTCEIFVAHPLSHLCLVRLFRV